MNLVSLLWAFLVGFLIRMAVTAYEEGDYVNVLALTLIIVPAALLAIAGAA